MTVPKNNFILSLYLILMSVLLILFNNLTIFCLANIFLLIIIFIQLKFDIKNPLLMFLTIFILYQISYPILNFLEIKVFEYVDLNEKYYLYNWLATLSFLFFYGKIKNVTYDVSNITCNINASCLKVIYFFLYLICILSSVYIIKMGYQSKYDLANSSNFILRIGNMAYTILVIFPVYFFLSKNIKRKNKIFIALITLLLMFFGMFTYGERSYVFNYIVVLIIYYFTFNKIDIKKIGLIFILSFVLLSTSSSLKMLFSNSNYKTSSDNNNMVISFLNSDFASAGFNFNYILNEGDSNIFYGKTYIYDILSPFDDILPIDELSSTKWYTNTYWSTRRTGLGFTIIGEGYINFGVFGIIFQMFILARMIKYFYYKSNKNMYYYVIYVGFISLTMYSSRQAIGNIISPLVKYHFLFALFIYMINKIVVKRGLENEIIKK